MKKTNPYASIIISSSLLTIMVIASETLPLFKGMLTSTFTHHWIAKAVIIPLSFIIASFIDPKTKYAGQQQKDLAWSITLGNFAIMFIFFCIHYLV